MNISWDSVHEMDEQQLETFAETHKVGLDREFTNLNDAADHVCVELAIANPEAGGDASMEVDRLAKTYAEQHNCTYGQALSAVLEADKELRDQYGQSFGVQKTALRN